MLRCDDTLGDTLSLLVRFGEVPLDPRDDPPLRSLLARRRGCLGGLEDEPHPEDSQWLVLDHLVPEERLIESSSSTPWEDLSRLEPCLLYTSPSPRDQRGSRMPSSA